MGAYENDTYFSLSISDGHRAGNILVAQSSSLNRSEVAARASSAALRACTKGSLNERAKAAVSTFCRVCRPIQHSIRGIGEDIYVGTKIACYLSKADGGIGPNPWLFIICSLRKMLQ